MSVAAGLHDATGNGSGVQLRSRREMEDQIRRQIETERARLREQAGLHQRSTEHFRKPAERAFTAAERDRVTILIGGLTWKHEWLVKAAFESSGYKVAIIPTPDVPAFQLGKEYGNNGQCNPTYFTVGHLIQYLQGLEAQGLSRQEIIDNYVFFTAGSCGPCRFGMYEAEYRLGVQNAGFDGFRVLLFQQNDGIKAASGEPGLKFTVDFGMGAFNAINFGDVMNDVYYQVFPYEVTAGQSDRVFTEVMEDLTRAIRDRHMYEVEERLPAWLVGRLQKRGLRNWTNTFGKLYDHLYGPHTAETLQAARAKIAGIEVDRLRVKPLVKITGEFFAQTTEGDGNFRMFAFLNREGAEIMVEPIANWVLYLLWQAKANHIRQKGLRGPRRQAWEVHRRLLDELNFRKKIWLFNLGQRMWNRQYERVIEGFGGIAHHLLDMQELADLAHPYYNQYARGGEGHLEVAKNIHYTVKKKAHMVLSLKPFGCMPSTQSDGVQSAVMNQFKDMIFLPIETSGEGEVNAHSRVQMALGEAKAKARTEFQEVLESTGKRLDDLRAFVDDHPVLRHPFYPMPRRAGITGTAANFALHVSDLMEGRTRLRQVA